MPLRPRLGPVAQGLARPAASTGSGPLLVVLSIAVGRDGGRDDRGRERPPGAEPRATATPATQPVVGEPVHDRPVRPGPRGRRPPHARRRRGRGPPERDGPHGDGARRDDRARRSRRCRTSPTSRWTSSRPSPAPGRRGAARWCSSGRAGRSPTSPRAGTVTVQLGPDEHEDPASPAASPTSPAPRRRSSSASSSATSRFDTLADLGFDDSFDELRIRVANPDGTRDQARAVAADVRDRLEKAGRRGGVRAGRRRPASTRPRTSSTRCSSSWARSALLSLAVSGFLVINTISAILAQQTRQIGMMKAVGARDRQVAGVYLGIVLGYALIALLVALPAGRPRRLAAHAVHGGPPELRGDRVLRAAAGASRSRSRSASSSRSPPRAWPVYRGVRVTVREAIASAGHRGRLRPVAVRPAPAADQGPLAADAAVDPEHVPAQVAARPDAARAHVRRAPCSCPCSRCARRSSGRVDETLAYFNYDVQVGARRSPPGRASSCGRRSRCRASSPRSRGRSRRRSACARTGRRAATCIVFGLPGRRPDGAPGRRGGAVPRPGRRQRARRDPQLPRRRAGRAHRRPGHAPRQGPRRDVHAGRHRPVADPAAVPVRAVRGPRRADPRRRARPGSSWSSPSARTPAAERDTGAAVRDTLERAGIAVAADADPERDPGDDRHAVHDAARVRVRDGAAAGRGRRAGARGDDDDERRRAVARDRRDAGDRRARLGGAGRVPRRRAC